MAGQFKPLKSEVAWQEQQHSTAEGGPRRAGDVQHARQVQQVLCSVKTVADIGLHWSTTQRLKQEAPGS